MASVITSVNILTVAVNRRRANPAGRRAAPTRAAGDGAPSKTAASPSDGASTFESPPRRPSPLERIMKDPLAAAVMGPRLALGGATEALDLLQKGQLLGVLAQAPGELNTLLQDPRPINDKAEDLVRRAEGMVETLEERGIAAEAPGREIFKAILPAELYDRYLDPAAVGAAATATQYRPSTDPTPPPPEYKAEPPTRSAAGEDDAAVPDTDTDPDPVPVPAAAEEEVSYEEKGSTPEATERRERGWVFDSDEDPAVIAAARAVASVLDSEEWDDDREAGLYPEVLGGQKLASTSSGDAIAEDGFQETAAPRSVEPAPVEAATTAPVASGSASPSVPPELWAAVEEAEKLAADVVMQASTVAARRER